MRAEAQPAASLEKALRTRAREFFIDRMTHFAAVMKLEVPRLALSSARTRWGSCNRDTGIRLNWRLIHCAPHLVDYVVVHELAHLRQMNHSPRFWREVEIVLPRYRDARRELRELSERLPQLD
jgi:predicted metal-dependent hydrolase